MYKLKSKFMRFFTQKFEGIGKSGGVCTKFHTSLETWEVANWFLYENSYKMGLQVI